MKPIQTLINVKLFIYLLGTVLLILIALPCTKKWHKEYKERRKEKKEITHQVWKWRNLS